MKPIIDSVEPAQATPTKATRPSYLARASSTEGASRLHEPQPGAQNHRTVGPEISGSSDTSSDDARALAADDSDTGSVPHAETVRATDKTHVKAYVRADTGRRVRTNSP